MTPIPFTQTGLDKIRAERDKLVAERPDAVSNLTKAREMGDLSENGYYKESRARLSFIDGRLRHLERILKNAVVMPAAKGNTVTFGSKVKLSSGDKELEFTVVGSFESDPMQKTISAKSPLGKALIDKKAGDEVTVTTPNGATRYTILSIE